jgi:hypothetical protein
MKNLLDCDPIQPRVFFEIQAKIDEGFLALPFTKQNSYQ